MILLGRPPLPPAPLAALPLNFELRVSKHFQFALCYFCDLPDPKYPTPIPRVS